MNPSFEPSSESNFVSISEHHPTIMQLTVRRGQLPSLAEILGRRFGLNLPQPGNSYSNGIYTLLWVQPGGWLLHGPTDVRETLFMELASLLAGIAAVVDQTHGKSVLRLSGPRSRQVLARCCRLDLHPRVFGPGRCAVTLVAHLPCVLRQIDETPCFDLMVASSLARWLFDELQEGFPVFGPRSHAASSGSC